MMAHSDPAAALELTDTHFSARERNEILQNLAGGAATEDVGKAFQIADEIAGRKGRETAVKAIFASKEVASDVWIERWNTATSVASPDLRMVALRIAYRELEERNKSYARRYMEERAADPMIRRLLQEAEP